MPTATREVQAALVTLWTATFNNTDTKVYDGPRKRGETPFQYLLVGVNGLDEDQAGLRSVQTPAGMGGGWREEAGEIDCTLVTWTGDADKLPQIRASSDTALGQIEADLNADPQLGGLIQPANNLAELVALDTREAQTPKGPFVEAVFTISYSTILS